MYHCQTKLRLFHSLSKDPILPVMLQHQKHPRRLFVGPAITRVRKKKKNPPKLKTDKGFLDEKNRNNKIKYCMTVTCNF